MVLGFWELPEEDQPPQELWLDDDALAEHFEVLKDKRESKRGGDKRESVPQAPMDQNELTRSWRK